MPDSLQIDIDEKNSIANVKLAGRLDVKNASLKLSQFDTQTKGLHLKKLLLDLSEVDYFDSAGAAVVIEIERFCKEQNCYFSIVGMTEDIKNFISLIDINLLAEPVKYISPERVGTIIRIGKASLKFIDDLKNVIVFIGEVTMALMYAIIHPRYVRWGDILLLFERTGVNAVPILITIQFLIGVILALLGAGQLAQFGAEIYVANLVAIAMVQELGPMITAVLVAGRSGAAFAAEIGTMKVSEEIDALESMGINPQHFLVIPRIIAVTLAMPCLLLIANVAGIVGGIVTVMLFLDIPTSMYIAQTLDSINMFIIFQGFVKSIVFAILIAGVGCMRGFEVKGGAGDVGLSTTSAVVSGIFLIVVFNGFFTVIFNT
ncbi:MlaE family lipid ABC transporter permease subunit [bacterium]|nr:MlaE family lipid ABC transporter permease subunit [bacterium]